MKMKKMFTLILLLFPVLMWAQTTTGVLTGTAKSSTGESLAGATITAVHTPTGSVYNTIAREGGRFTLPNLRVGGPYRITVNYTGYTAATFDDLYITLGNPLVIDALLLQSSITLGDVKVTGTAKGSLISSQRTGTSTFISQRQIQNMPTINRSIQDFARLTPQASTLNNGSDGTSRGISFGGQNNRYNQFSIDGANASDAFGLTSSGTNGGQANINPISVEAIQEVQVVLSPYDVSEGGFTGGGINAVTKSGTNKFHGAVYGVGQNEGFVGKNVPNKLSNGTTPNRVSYNDFKNTTYGAGVGGPIIKNKLFFFVNAERFEKSTPLGFDPTVAGSGSNFNADTLESLRQFLINTYKFDPGSYGAISTKNFSTSVFGRIDWNINGSNKLTIRHSYVQGSNDIISRSASSVVFSNGGYKFVNKTNSTVAELNSNFSNASNVLRVTYNNIKDKRATPFFPTLTILNAGLTYNIGSDASSQVNGLDQSNYTITDNFTLYRGRHTITIGTNNEFFNTRNLFLQNYYGAYAYNNSAASVAMQNIANFKANKNPDTYNVGYSVKGGDDKAEAVLHAAQLSLYGQDVYAVRDNFKLTYGLRIDMPVYFNKPPTNTGFDTAAAFAVFNVKTEQMPKAIPLFSPRAGFNWDIKNNGKSQLRGGAGLFTGRIPFVWVSNQFSNTGVTNIAYTANAAQAVTNNIRFNYNPNDPHAGAYIPSTAPAATATVINVIDKKFKFPQVFRANLAFEQRLPWWGLIGSVEAVYTKTINNANYQNLNLTYFPDSTVRLGANETRPLWTKRVTNAYTDVLLLTNTSKGYSYSFTAQIQKPYSKGWTGMLAYTYGHSTSLSDLTSSVALSNWRFAYATRGLNNLDLSNSNFDMGSRIVGAISKEFKYAKRFATTISLFYNGQSGQRISYLYSRTITGDDISSGSQSNTIAYIPRNLAEANFVSFNRTVNGVTTAVTAAQQFADFQGFVLGNKYLKEHIGRNTERNGDKLPFENHFDLRLTQDILLVKGHKLQITFDILNLGNLLDKNKGWSYNLANQSINLFTVLNTGTAPTATNGTPSNPKFQFDITRMGNVNGTYKPYFVSDFTSRWNSQVGLKYSF